MPASVESKIDGKNPGQNKLAADNGAPVRAIVRDDKLLPVCIAFKTARRKPELAGLFGGRGLPKAKWSSADGIAPSLHKPVSGKELSRCAVLRSNKNDSTLMKLGTSNAKLIQEELRSSTAFPSVTWSSTGSDATK